MTKGLRTVGMLAIVICCVFPAVPDPHHVDAKDTTTTTYPQGDIEKYRPGAMSIDRIRQIGTIPNLNQGIVLTINNVSTRLIAWPGQGMVQGAIHLLTLPRGAASPLYSYPVSEEAMECISGSGEVYLWDKWVTLHPGDVAYFPENVKHGVRNRNGSKPFVVISQLTPPQLSLYEPDGLFDSTTGKFDQDKIDELLKTSAQGTLREADLEDLQYRDDNAPMRAWRNNAATIRKKGALFNIFKGARFEGIGVPMVIVLFPGYGTRNAGLHTGVIPKGSGAHDHTHAMNDDCVIYLQGQGNVIMNGESINLEPLNAVAAPILAPHGAGEPAPLRSLLSGYGAPPQQELYERQGYIVNGQYITPKYELLDDVEKDMTGGTTATPSSH